MCGSSTARRDLGQRHTKEAKPNPNPNANANPNPNPNPGPTCRQLVRTKSGEKKNGKNVDHIVVYTYHTCFGHFRTKYHSTYLRAPHTLRTRVQQYGHHHATYVHTTYYKYLRLASSSSRELPKCGRETPLPFGTQKNAIEASETRGLGLITRLFRVKRSKMSSKYPCRMPRTCCTTPMAMHGPAGLRRSANMLPRHRSTDPSKAACYCYWSKMHPLSARLIAAYSSLDYVVYKLLGLCRANSLD